MKRLLLPFLLLSEVLLSQVYFSMVDDLSFLVISHLESASDVTVVAYSIDPDYLGLKECSMATEVPVEGAFVHISDGLLHSKFIVLDHETVIFGSANFNRSSLEEHLNNLIVFHSKEIADFFEGIYDWLVHGKRPQVRLKTEEGEFFLIPAVDVEEIVLDSLWKAKRYVLLCSYAFTDEDVFATLKFLSSQGVEVYIITDEWFESSRLRELPLETFHVLEVREPLMHHKFLVVDGKTLITGSANFTESGFHRNVEVMFETSNREYVESFEEEFNRIWRDTLYRVFVFDLDGTLLNDSLEISEKDRKVIERLSRNCHVVFASGRMLVSTLNVEKRYFKRTFPTIAYNGAMVYLPEEGVVLNEKIPPEVAKDIIEYIKPLNVHWQAYIDDVLYSEKDNEEIKSYARHSNVDYRVEPNLSELVSKMGTTKLLLIDTPERLDELKEILSERFKDVVKVFKSFPTYLEIVPKNVDKGKALKFLRGRMNWKKEEIVVFGDNENDLFMFEEAGLRVAMGNAIDKVKEAADVVTLTNNDSGVSYVLERISTDCLDE